MSGTVTGNLQRMQIPTGEESEYSEGIFERAASGTVPISLKIAPWSFVIGGDPEDFQESFDFGTTPRNFVIGNDPESVHEGFDFGYTTHNRLSIYTKAVEDYLRLKLPAHSEPLALGTTIRDALKEQRRSQRIRDVEGLLEEAGQPDWDGEDGLPVSNNAVSQATDFLSNCPAEAFDASVDFSADCSGRGGVMLTWATDHQHLLTILVTPEGRLVHSMRCSPKVQERERTGVSDWWPQTPVPEDIASYFSRLATAAAARDDR